jgi:CheY-like chemotaxis protein
MGHIVLMIGTFDACFDEYRAALSERGFSAMTTDADDALRLLTAVRPGVCVLDVRSLGERAWELCETIRATPALLSTSILLWAETRRYPRGVLAARARGWHCTVFSARLAASDFVDGIATLIGCGGSA